MEELDIEPVWNVPYHCSFNDAVEKYWALLKQRFRRILLSKMLESPCSRETPLNDALREAFINTPEEPVIKFVHMGIRQLREAANEIRKKTNQEEVEDYNGN